MRTVSSREALGRVVRSWKKEHRRIGFVPTMGALHAGHLKLVEVASRECDRVVVSIYVNPTQFGANEDLSRYPRPKSRDLNLCQRAKVDLVFAPQNLYLPDASTWVSEEEVSQGRCGRSRSGHFRGVATVVLKLLNLVAPDRAYFGWKDAQQVEVIQRMVRDLDVPVKIVPVEMVRDRDGLALSSRNSYLTTSERQVALAIPLLLQIAVSRKDGVLWLRRELGKRKGIRLDYVEAVNGRLCVAAWVGKTRLLDNRPLDRVG